MGCFLGGEVFFVCLLFVVVFVFCHLLSFIFLSILDLHHSFLNETSLIKLKHLSKVDDRLKLTSDETLTPYRHP